MNPWHALDIHAAYYQAVRLQQAKQTQLGCAASGTRHLAGWRVALVTALSSFLRLYDKGERALR
jgi:hypothetical protein